MLSTYTRSCACADGAKSVLVGMRIAILRNHLKDFFVVPWLAPPKELKNFFFFPTLFPIRREYTPCRLGIIIAHFLPVCDRGIV